ncbi:MAG TPA: hypothetical protein VKH44_07675, partial [Pirellulaceae bacterium]|nr:hypothetical protein [Pirellulaceae bacterium]
MKHRLRSLTWFGVANVVVAVTSLAMEARSQESGVGSQKVGAPTDSRPPTPDPRLPSAASGQQLVAEAAKRVASEVSIAAEMRYRIDVFGHELVGTGSYLQYGAGPEKLLRLDLRMPVGDKQATVLEIRGEETYWLRRDVPPSPPTLGRVDIHKLRKSLTQGTTPSPGDVLPQGDWIMLGGLARLVSALEQNFVFTAPQADELRFKAGDGKSIV